MILDGWWKFIGDDFSQTVKISFINYNNNVAIFLLYIPIVTFLFVLSIYIDILDIIDIFSLYIDILKFIIQQIFVKGKMNTTILFLEQNNDSHTEALCLSCSSQTSRIIMAWFVRPRYAKASGSLSRYKHATIPTG